MPDEFADRLRGRRARTTVDGTERAGTITSVTYTLKGGEPVVELSLDEPTPTGREAVAVGLSDLDATPD